MSKKTILISFIILCGAFCSAQIKIDLTTYNKLVDYCNCVYEYLNQYYENNNNTNDDYLSVVLQTENIITGTEGEPDRPKIESVSINKNEEFTIIKKEYYSLDFTICPSGYTPQKIEWKTKDNNIVELSDVDQLKCKFKFIKEGKAKITVTVDGKKDTKTFIVKDGSPPGRWSVFKNLFVFAIIILLIYWLRKRIFILIADFIKKVFSQKKTKDDELSEKCDNCKYFNTLENNLQQIENLKGIIKKLENHFNGEITSLQKKISDLQNKNKNDNQQLQEFNNKVSNIETHTHTQIIENQILNGNSLSTCISTLYANSIVDDVFRGINTNLTEDTVFVLNLQTPTTATFTIHADKFSRVIRRPEFLKGCNIQTVDGGQNLCILEIGEAKLDQSDDRWVIIKKLNILIS